jgi:hypothetical protein
MMGSAASISEPASSIQQLVRIVTLADLVTSRRE